MKTIICTPIASASYSGYWCFVPSHSASPRDHAAVVEDAEPGAEDRVEEQRPEEADDEADGQERDRSPPPEPRAQPVARARRRSPPEARSRRCSRAAPTTAAHPRSCSAATTTACEGWPAGTARTSPSRRAPRSRRSRWPRCTRGAAGAGGARRKLRYTPSDDERDPADVGEGDRRRQQRRQLIVHSSSRSVRSRRASGSKRSTSPKIRTISPNSVPSMMTAPTSVPLLRSVAPENEDGAHYPIRETLVAGPVRPRSTIW